MPIKLPILTTIILLFLFASPAMANNEGEIQAAFLREGNVWLYIDGEETQITNTNTAVGTPQWSHDGKWLAYQLKTSSPQPLKSEEQTELWAYHLATGEKKKLFHDGYSPAWAPTENILAFTSNGVLNISDLHRFYNVALGVNSFAWFPEGEEMLLSSRGELRPDGWTGANLYTKKLKGNYPKKLLTNGANEFFPLPKEVGIPGSKIIAVHANHFSFSPSNKWISFIVTPTASMAMDSNMLCVISQDGENFQVLDEIILQVGKPKWAPSQDTIAFIAGHGRIVFGFKNKSLKFKEMTMSRPLTPENYADLDFDWVSDTTLVASRIEEKEWTNDFSEHPLPSLYIIQLEGEHQTKITDPPEGLGDYEPQYVPSIEKLIWVRKSSLIAKDRTLWISNRDGTDAKEWLKNVEIITIYNKT